MKLFRLYLVQVLPPVIRIIIPYYLEYRNNIIYIESIVYLVCKER